MIAWIIVIFLFVAIIMQPSPKRRPRGRHRHHHRGGHHHSGARTAKKEVVADPDVISALRNLGYSAKDAKTVVQRSAATTGFEAVLKQSLEFLRKPDAKALAG